MSDVLEEATRIVKGPRQKMYGSPYDNWVRTAQIQGSILGLILEPEDAVLQAIAMKIARLRKTPDHWDSIVDIAGYAWVYGEIVKEKERKIGRKKEAEKL